MSRSRSIAIAAAGLLAVAVAGCGFGAGPSSEGTATMRITRDFGAQTLDEATDTDPPASETVARFLDRETDIETSYGGNFIDSIDGLAGNKYVDGHPYDWFFYVNGYWSPIGAGESKVHAGDRIWWDYHDWTEAEHVPAVVGSWPEPFAHGYDGKRYPTELTCMSGHDDACGAAQTALRDAGADLTVAPGEQPTADPSKTLRVLVGSWDDVRADPSARLLEQGTATSGVYAKPEPCRSAPGWGLDVLTADGDSAGGITTDAGWVAATQRGSEQPTWVVTGTTPDGVGDAAGLLDEGSLRDNYALATVDGTAMPLPAAQPFSSAGCGEEVG